MSQIEKKNQEFVKTNAAALDKKNNQEFGYWKSLKDISSEEDIPAMDQSSIGQRMAKERRDFSEVIV